MALHAFRDKDHELLRYELHALKRPVRLLRSYAWPRQCAMGYATPLALFSIKQAQSGPPHGCEANIKDVSSQCSARTRTSRCTGFDRYNKRKELNKSWWKIKEVAMRIDFEAWLNLRERRIAKVLATPGTEPRGSSGSAPAALAKLPRQFMEA